MFFWVFPRRHILVCRRFGTYYRFHLQRLDVECEVWMVKPSQTSLPGLAWHSGFWLAFRMKYAKKPAAEAVAAHQGPQSESRGQPPSEVGD
jgi:hypothetical protein